jgi:hypothetical protein
VTWTGPFLALRGAHVGHRHLDVDALVALQEVVDHLAARIEGPTLLPDDRPAVLHAGVRAGVLRRAWILLALDRAARRRVWQLLGQRALARHTAAGSAPPTPCLRFMITALELHR